MTGNRPHLLKLIGISIGVSIAVSILVTGIWLGTIGITRSQQGIIVAITDYTAPAPCLLGQCGTIPEAQLRIITQGQVAVATSQCQGYWHINDTVKIEWTIRIFQDPQIIMHDRNDPSGTVGQCGSLNVKFQ